MSSRLYGLDDPTGRATRPAEASTDAPGGLRQRARERAGRTRRMLTAAWRQARSRVHAVLIGAAAFAGGMLVGAGPNAGAAGGELRDRLGTAERQLHAREGELELVRLQMRRVDEVLARSTRYRIPADLSAQIYDVARSEGIDPDLAFRLVAVESEFTRTAVSPRGAIGLTQVMPGTARQIDPRITREDLFHRETNLRLGFSYLRGLIRAYGGDLRLALLAYNRGPAVVDSIRKRGGNPTTGYVRAVLAGARRPTRTP